ncbi:sushi, von Willebrand factor type A, EGF and pentraxin domain-containing protein 1-like, partial [Saccoglossus kowalevskii]
SGSIVTFGCDPGYTLIGDSAVRCEQNGNWSAVPKCVPRKCESPSSIDNGKITSTGSTYGDTMKYSCDKGHYLIGEDSRKCDINGKWSGNEPVCQVVTCKHPTKPDHGDVSVNDHTYGSIAEFWCEAGYVLKGNKTAKCFDSGDWVSAPTCEPVECGLPENPLHGTRNVTGVVFRDTVTYDCDYGYNLSGVKIRTCLESSLWSGIAAECIPVSCGKPKDVDDAKHIGSNHYYGGSVIYKCREGYLMTGHDNTTCQANGEWSEPPRCNPVKCGFPKQIKHGKLTVTGIELRQVVMYNCEVGYQIQGTSRRICQPSGNWSNRDPSCEPVECGPPPHVPNANNVGNNYTYNQQVVYSCKVGHEMAGAAISTCTANREWTTPPECRPINCNLPPDVEHASSVGHYTTFGSTVNYTCDNGYLSKHNLAITCLADRNWTPAPICQPVNCGTPWYVDHAVINGSQFTYSKSVTYSCELGYILKGDAEHLCRADATWSGSSPVCEIINCGTPDVVHHAEYTGTNFSYGSILEFNCLSGYTIHGNETVICREDGKWTQVPHCEPVNCGAPQSVPNSLIEVSGNTFGDSVKYDCNVGYKLYGIHEITCLADAQWSDNVPVCQIISCGTPYNVTHATYTSTGDVYNSVTEYACDEGYDMIGEDTITCLHNEEWAAAPICVPVDCGTPHKIHRGSIIFSGQVFGDTVEYSCDKGYKIIGNKQRNCLSTGSWSSQEPECKLISCGEPLKLDHGRYTARAHVYGSKVEYSCHSGYELAGSATVECLATGQWSQLPICLPVSCFVPETIPHSIITATTYTHGSIVSYECETGYQLRGNHQRTCQADASWSGKPPTCDIIQCGPPVDVNYAVVNGENYVYESIVEFICEPGYKMIGNSNVICQETGKWTIPPVCSPVSCGPPTSVSHGSVLGEGYTYKQTVQYQCDVGYILIGEHERTCQNDGSWGGESPVCQIISCGPPKVVDKATQTGDRYTFGNAVNYKCDVGYRLQGNKTIICLADSKWTAGPMCNPVDCGRPDEIDNGVATVHGTTFKERTTYTCNLGYLLEGDSHRDCLEDGSWSGEAPECRIVTCGTAVDLHHASHNGSGIHQYDDAVHYRCHVGYEKQGYHIVKCTDTGEWTDQPTCQPVSCDRLDRLANGRIQTSGHTYQHNATYNCDKGYHLLGNSVRTCLANKTWSGVSPSCDLISCGTQPEIQHARSDNSSEHTYGAVVEFSCNSGYVLSGNSTIICKENGQWTHPPVCTPITCQQPDAVENAIVSSNGHSYKHKISYRCDIGHQLIGDSERECLADGSWSGEAPLCQIMSCGLPHEVSHADYIGGTFTYGSSVRYSCHSGYDLKGYKVIRCLMNGVWTPGPVCTPVLCKDLEQVDNAIATFTGQTFGHRVIYACYTGFQLNGDSERVCQANGEWDGESPVCEVVRCSRPPNVRFGLSRGNYNDEYDSFVRYICKPGYRITGTQTVRCEASGKWSTPPSCVPVKCTQLTNIPHGTATTLRNTYGGSVLYDCEQGYTLIGSKERICEASATWSESQPTCRIVSCGLPTDVPYASHSSSDYTFKSTVSYICDPGYEMVGDATSECQASGSWTAAPVCIPVSCGQPAGIQHASIIGDDFSYGDTVKVECHSGFYIQGEQLLRCQTNRKWSARPECIIVTCGEPTPILHATVVAHELNYGNKAEYKCFTGYELRGNNMVVCQSTSEWTAPPACEPVSCGPPPSLDHATTTSTGHRFTDVITYHCDIGYRLEGQVERECNAYGHWSGESPQCLLISCGAPEKVSNSVQINTAYTYNSIVTYNCKPGYELIGTREIVCTVNSEWTPEPPECRIVKCPTPKPIVNGQIHGTEYTFSHVVTYTCKSGYRLVGIGSQTCLMNKTWSYTQPKCEGISCKPPDTIAHGQVVGDTFDFDSTVQYVCNAGYELVGTGIRKCTADSSWSEVAPLCIPVVCGTPPHVDHGRYSLQHGDDFTYKSRVQYRCDIGYTEDIDGLLECGEDSRWYGRVPICHRISCGEPQQPENGFIKSGNFLYQDTVQYTCLPGFNLVGQNTRDCLSSKQWTGHVPLCEPISCGPPPVVRFSKAHGVQYTFNSTVLYTCHRGYSTVGESEVRCLDSGSWSDDVPTCVPVSCGVPPRLRNGNYHGMEYTFGNSLHYYCHPGYTIQGSPLQHCAANGQWNGTTPQCVPVQCSAPNSIKYGTIIGTIWALGNTIHYGCHTGYQLLGNSSRTCQASGEWSGQTPTCQPISCGNPPVLEHSFISGGNYNYGDYVVYVCQDGYILHGNSVRQCQEDARWSGGNVTCDPVYCSEISSPVHGNVIAYDYSFGSKSYYSCNDGFTLRGASYRTCLASGDWSGQVPRCEPVSCGPAPAVSNAVTLTSANRVAYKNQQFVFGNSVWFDCQIGYRLEGKVVVVCNADGNWSEPPTCQPLQCSALASIDHGYVTSPGYTVNTTAMYGCYDGYELHGSSTTVCLTDQTWSHPQPVCQPISCGQPTKLSNSVLQSLDSETSYRSIINYKCKVGYRLIGGVLPQLFVHL